MNTNSELARIVSDWLEVRVVDPPHGSLANALALAQVTAQRRRWWHRWLDIGGRGMAGERHRPGLGTAAMATSVILLAVMATIGLQPRLVDRFFPPVTGTTWSVAAEGGDFVTIGEAVAAAADGDTIVVEPGVYEEGIVIDKDITLAGGGKLAGNVTIKVPQDAPGPAIPLPPNHRHSEALELPDAPPVGIQLIDSDATVRNLHVVGRADGIDVFISGGAPTLERVNLRQQDAHVLADTFAGGLYIEGGSRASLDDVDVSHRVRIGGGSAPTISGSRFASVQVTIQDGSTPVIIDSSLSGQCGCAAIEVLGGSSATFRGDTFAAAVVDVRGDLLEDGSRDGTYALIEENRFNFNELGTVTVRDRASATVTGNHFTGNQQGVYVAAASADIRDNAFHGNWNGVTLREADATLAGNLIRGGTFGVSVIAGGSPLISGNTIEDNSSRGIFVADGTSPRIEGNSVCGSSHNLVVAPEAAPVLGDNDICPDAAEPAE